MNFKKIFALVSIILWLPLAVFASSDTIQIIDDTTLDDSPTTVTSSAVYIGYFSQPSVYILYDETDPDSAVSTAVSMQVSHDGSNWIDSSWYDFAGGSTFQTSETLSADANYVGWLEDQAHYPYIRVIALATGGDATNSTVINAYIAGNR